MFDPIIRRLERMRLTRESLVRMALAIFGGAVALSIMIQLLGFGPDVVQVAARTMVKKGYAQGEERLVEHLRVHPEEREVWIGWCRLRGEFLDSPGGGGRGALTVEEGMGDRFEAMPLPVSRLVDHAPYLDEAAFEEQIASSPVPLPILRAWRGHTRPARALEILRPFPDDFETQLAGGDLAIAGRRPDLAAPWYARAYELDPKSEEAAAGWTDALFRSLRDDAFLSAIEDPFVRRASARWQIAAFHERRGDLRAAFLPTLGAQFQGWTLAVWVGVFITGACWALLIFHLGHGWSWLRSNQLLVPVAVFLGWVSVELTFYFMLLERHYFGIEEPGRPLTWYMLHCFFIGFREEVLKLACFVPLLFVLVRRATDVHALVLASLVGLGFAISENGNYFLFERGEPILGRYMTANFAHMALTGYVGYFLFRAARIRRKPEVIAAIEALAKVIIVHAAYDFFIIAPQVSGWSFLSTVIFILISQQYLRLIFHVRHHRRQRVSATRIFVACLATVTGMHYLFLSTHEGIAGAVWHTFGGLIGVGIICFMYFHELDERVG